MDRTLNFLLTNSVIGRFDEHRRMVNNNMAKPDETNNNMPGLGEADYDEVENHIAQAPKDMVHNPSHYQLEDGSELKDHLVAILGVDGFLSYSQGNVLKYISRYNKKDDSKMIQDLEKVQEYSQMMIDVINYQSKIYNVYANNEVAGTHKPESIDWTDLSGK